jgi:hypothetical protein
MPSEVVGQVGRWAVATPSEAFECQHKQKTATLETFVR